MVTFGYRAVKWVWINTMFMSTLLDSSRGKEQDLTNEDLEKGIRGSSPKTLEVPTCSRGAREFNGTRCVPLPTRDDQSPR